MLRPGGIRERIRWGCVIAFWDDIKILTLTVEMVAHICAYTKVIIYIYTYISRCVTWGLAIAKISENKVLGGIKETLKARACYVATEEGEEEGMIKINYSISCQLPLKVAICSLICLFPTGV